jgi:hypothetical protein
VSGKVSYAVLGFGGFLGIGQDHYPLPWSSLVYDERLGGYRVAITLEQLEGAPRYARDQDWTWTQHERIDSYYGNPPSALGPVM